MGTRINTIMQTCFFALAGIFPREEALEYIKGAIKKTGKGNPTAGSGGRRRQGLEGKGPTPRAEDRPNHKIYKMKNATQKREAARPKRKQGDAAEWVAGRNPVVELLRATVPIHALYVAEGTERDERIREIFKLAAEQHVSLLEIGRIERALLEELLEQVASPIPATSVL